MLSRPSNGSPIDFGAAIRNARKPHGISRNYEIYPIHLPERRSHSLGHFREQLEMRAFVRSAWSRCVCNLHLSMQAAAIQGAMLQRLTVVPLRLYHDLTLERRLIGIFRLSTHPKDWHGRYFIYGECHLSVGQPI